ncbi:MAG TPA: CdaR family protein [Pyrinomonadaceae bacterium]|jgi:YbbR domain-containing protein
MPFHDIDEEPKPLVHTRAPHWAERLLRRIFFEDLGLKLLALAISLGLWYGVTGQRTPTTVRVPRVPLNFRLPKDMEISNEPRAEVEVTLTGNKRALDTLNLRDLSVNVDVTDYKPGEHSVQLTPERVTMGLPDGVRSGDIQPGRVLLRLEPRIERELEVEVRRSGSLPSGYELISLAAMPAKVRVRGPESHVNALQKAWTEIISLEGHRESFTLSQIAVEMPDKKVDLIDPIVGVRVEINEERIERGFANVTVEEIPGAKVRPASASVVLYGPRSVIEQLRAADLNVALDVSPDGALTPRLLLPDGLQDRVESRSIKLSGLSLK